MSQRSSLTAILVKGVVVSGCLALAGSAGAQLGRKGNLDAVFANEGRNRVCLGDGAGGFSCSDVSTDTYYTSGVALGFLDGDLNPDVVFSHSVCLGDGAGGFACSDLSGPCAGGPRVALGFVDGDKNLDAVFSSLVCFGDGAGGFTHSAFIGDAGIPFDVALGFVDGDKKLDAVFANRYIFQTPPYDRVCLGDGAGGFACSNVSDEWEDSYDVALGYVDEDGNLDAVFTYGHSYRVCFGDGGGGFSCSAYGAANGASAVALGFVDSDDKLDALFSGANGTQVCLGNGTGSFYCSYLDQVPAQDVALGFVDGDRNLDAVFANGRYSYPQRNRVCLGDGKGGFACSDVSDDTNYTLGVALGDVNNPLIFADGFESSDTLAWSATVP